MTQYFKMTRAELAQAYYDLQKDIAQLEFRLKDQRASQMDHAVGWTLNELDTAKGFLKIVSDLLAQKPIVGDRW